ncbi:MAG: hypothetical protein U1F81_19380 [Verrucomicrobiaceae bacterium]
MADGGYEVLKRRSAWRRSAITNEVKASGLRGRSAGFPTGVKWGFIPPTNTKPVYLICNADESESPALKTACHRDPHQLIEGMTIACYAVGAKLAYIYIREEFHKEPAIIVEKTSPEATRRVSSAKTITRQRL